MSASTVGAVLPHTSAAERPERKKPMVTEGVEDNSSPALVAGPSSATIEQMIATLRMEFKQDMTEFQSKTDTKLDPVQTIIQAAAESLEVCELDMESEVSTHDQELNDMRQHTADTKYMQMGTEAAAMEVKLFEEKAPPPPPPAAGWDREPDRTVAKASCKAEVSYQWVREVVDALSKEICPPRRSA